MELSSIIHRFPTIELSYETFVHKKVDELDTGNEILLAIPYGPKYYIWITFGTAGEPHICYALELNRNKKIVQSRILPDAEWYKKYSHGTILYVTYIQDENVYIVEDIYYVKGVYLRNVNCLTRLQYLYDLFSDAGNQTQLYLPHMYTSFAELTNKPNYQIHHIQKRNLTMILPYINIAVDRYGKISTTNTPVVAPAPVPAHTPTPAPAPIIPDPRKPQFRVSTPFWVRAEILPDIYSLYAMDHVFYGTAHIPSYKISKSMNRIFRIIRENKCIESAEDSEDDEEFENTAIDKYVDLTKCVLMECVYMTKFGKWVPIKQSNNTEAVQLQNLIKETNINKPTCSSYYNVQKPSFTKGFRYTKETAGRVGGRFSGQYGRNTHGKTQFSSSGRYSAYEKIAGKV